MKTWADITVKQWQSIQPILDTEQTEIQRWVKLLPIFEPITIDQVREQPLSKTRRMAYKWQKLLDTEITAPLKSKWTHGDKTYVCDLNPKNITAAQFIDSSELNKQGNVIENYHRFLAVWYHEEGKGYDAKGFEERASYIQEHMTMDVAYPVAAFFLTSWESLLPHIQSYLKTRADQIGSQTRGTGMRLWIGCRVVYAKIGIAISLWVLQSSLTILRILQTSRSMRSRLGRSMKGR